MIDILLAEGSGHRALRVKISRGALSGGSDRENTRKKRDYPR